MQQANKDEHGLWIAHQVKRSPVGLSKGPEARLHLGGRSVLPGHHPPHKHAPRHALHKLDARHRALVLALHRVTAPHRLELDQPGPSSLVCRRGRA